MGLSGYTRAKMSLRGAVGVAAPQAFHHRNWSSPMKSGRRFRVIMMLCSGLVLLQAAGCGFQEILNIVQTGLLGVTAAGAVAILQNI